MAEKIYSEIPMRTWRWLGVNEARGEETVDLPSQDVRVAAGEVRELTVAYRQEGQSSLRARVEAGGMLKLTTVQLVPGSGFFGGDIEIYLAEGARLEASAVEAGAGQSISRMRVYLQGDGAQASVYVLYFGDGDRRLDMNYIMVQEGKNTEAKLYVHGALLGQADKIFRGTLDFRRGAKGSRGYEKEQAVVLSGKVRNRSVPLMLSAEEAVEGHHAVSIGKIDDSKLFYLMSRGLDLTEARRLVVEAAFNPVLDRIEAEELRQELQTYIKERLADA
ncbi:MAG: SufD family Fe-S cluster assembly protein [Anaerovibrio sp.]|nr:SufD family Fe-S cluster assembly protein [Anaerovibrio sp.]